MAGILQTSVSGWQEDQQKFKHMSSKELVTNWFNLWENGDFHGLPLSDDFRHTSPYGIVQGKKAYMDLIEANKEQFLGYQFEFHDALYEEDKACIRYTAVKAGFRLEVSEWHYTRDDQILEIVAYYNLQGHLNQDLQQDYG